MGLFSPEAIAELRAEAIKTADIFEQTYFQNMFPVMFKDVDSLGDKAVDELIGKQAAFGENYKKVINAMNLLDDKKYGAKALETKEVSKEIAEAFPTVAVGNPEFKEELLNSLEEAFAMFDDFKIYVEPPNRSRLNVLPEVWEKPEEMLGEIGRAHV